MKRSKIGSVIFLILFLLGVNHAPSATQAAPLKLNSETQQAGEEDPAIRKALEEAFQAVVHQNQLKVLGFVLYDIVIDHVAYSEDGSTALLWLAMFDRETQEVVAGEPGYSIAVNPSQSDPTISANWQITLQSDASFQDQLSALPPDLLTEDLVNRFLEVPQDEIQPQAAGPLTGYKLPWAAGQEKRLSGSIGHYLIYGSCSEATCRYAYDFADGTMFPLLAAKGGVVKSAKWTCRNGDEKCTNYLVLEDKSTTPTSYQLYYHMAYESIPPALRVPGTPVVQGQYIGDVDDTGASTGHHLHYHVFQATTRADYSWGYSVDIVFDEVSINGGRPRTCYEAANWPSLGSECNVGRDGKMFTSDDNLFRSANVQVNPLTCSPGVKEVAVFAEPNFQGRCSTFKIGSYNASQLGQLGDNSAQSILVGSEVRAVMYDNSSDLTASVPTGRIETFDASDSSLIDNRIGPGRMSAIQVMPFPITDGSPLEPILTPPGNLSGLNPTTADSLVLTWTGGIGADQFYSEIKNSAGTVVKKLDWQNLTTWSIGNLPKGNYTWMVRARNSAYTSITNTSSLAFSVEEAPVSPTSASQALAVPYNQDFESGEAGWEASGLWNVRAVQMGNRGNTRAWMFNNGVNYSDPVRYAGDLTSPPINIPSSGNYYLRFSSYSDVEDGNPYFDQRRVQVSVNNGPFTDIYQFSDDKQAGPIWIESPALSLNAYRGKQIRVRFHFNTVDKVYNSGWGWMIDNVRINSEPPDLSCADTNNAPAEAQTIKVGQSISANLCPQGDVDYYSFQGKAGQLIIFSTTAKSAGSLLDTYLFLLDTDRINILKENDDEVLGEGDSRLVYVLTRDGTYYIKVRAWDHPGAGGAKYTYKLNFEPPKQIFLPLINRQ